MVKVELVRLADIVIDLSIRTREPEQFTINTYRQSFRAGAKFPPLVLERSTKRLVCGWHRYGMYRAECEPDYMVECILEAYSTELALWERAVSDNVANGRPLDTWDKKRILLKLQELGSNKESIAKLLNVTTEKLEEWGGMMVVVVGQREGKEHRHSEPVKHGLEYLVGQIITEERYERDVIRNGTGVNIRRHAFAIRRLLKNDWIEDDEDTVRELEALSEVLTNWLRGRGMAVAV